MMTEQEYREKLAECIAYKKWQVVADAVSLLNNMNDNFETMIREFIAERKSIIKMLDSDVSNKQKLDFVKSFAEDWKGTKNE